MDKVKLQRQMKKFEEHLMVDKGISDVTAGGYCRSLSIALKRMRKYVPDYQSIKEYLLWMYKEKYSYNHTVNTIVALEKYTSFKGNPVTLGRPKKPQRLIPDNITEAEMSRIFHATKNTREKALAAVFAYSGLRNLEVCNVRVSDVDVGQNQIRVASGKGYKDRYVNIAAECSKVIVEYLRDFPREDKDFLFTTLCKKTRMKTADLRKHIRKLARRCGITRRIYPHLFRHSLATNLLNRGAGIIMIKEQLGHRHLESTLIYANSSPHRQKSEYEHFKPAYL